MTLSHLDLDCKEEPFHQLARLLGLSIKHVGAQELKNILRELASQEFDDDFTPGEQPGAIKRMREKLVHQLPHIFSTEEKDKNEKRLYSAIRTASRYHYERRRRIGKTPGMYKELFKLRRRVIGSRSQVLEKKKNEVNELSDSVADPNSKDGGLHMGEENVFPPKEKGGKVKEISVSHLEGFPRILHDSSGPSALACHPPLPTRSVGGQISSLNFNYYQPLHFNSTSAASIAGPSTQASVSSSSHIGIGNSTNRYNDVGDRSHFNRVPINTRMIESTQQASSKSNQDLEQDPAYYIRTFLENCQPPMVQFLINFIEYGCVTNEYLRSLARFSQAKRRNVLRRIITGHLNSDPREGNEKTVSEMDLDILEDQFERSFS